MTDAIHIAVGANHRSAPPDLREAMFVSRDETPAFYGLLKARGFSEAVLISTCDRVEVHAVHDEPAAGVGALRDMLAARAGIEPMDRRIYGLVDRAAMRQLLAVAASLDSLIVGEPQVLGQLKKSHREAARAGMMGSALERRLQAAYGAAKRVRSETRIGERPVSIASAAVEVARRVHGDLSRRLGLLLGVGEAGELIATRMKNHGLGRLHVLHRRLRIARSVAERLDAPAVPFENRDAELAAADILILAVGSGGSAVTADDMRSALRTRRRRPVFLVDAGVPADADPAIDRLDDVFLYNLDHLERMALVGRARREDEAAGAWRIVEAALSSFTAAAAQRGAAPAIAALRDRFEAARREVLAGRAGRNPDEATRLLVNRLLHDPSDVLRRLAERDPDAVAGVADLLDRLFPPRDGRRA